MLGNFAKLLNNIDTTMQLNEYRTHDQLLITEYEVPQLPVTDRFDFSVNVRSVNTKNPQTSGNEKPQLLLSKRHVSRILICAPSSEK